MKYCINILTLIITLILTSSCTNHSNSIPVENPYFSNAEFSGLSSQINSNLVEKGFTTAGTYNWNNYTIEIYAKENVSGKMYKFSFYKNLQLNWVKPIN